VDALRVLVTDDEPGMRLGVTRILRGFTVDVAEVGQQVGFVVEQADCGEAALQIIADNPPDILILDHKMTGISGLDVLDRVVPMQLDMLTIMITAYASIETAVLATKRGAYDFLAKPFTPVELRNTVRKAAVRQVLAKQARHLAAERRAVRLQFTRMLAHELQAPLNAIDGYLDMMAEQVHGPDVASYEKAIVRSQERIEGMRKLIRDLLDMTQIEAGRRRRRLVPLDVVDVARAALETAAPDAASRDIELRLEGQPQVPMTADRSELEIVWNNLVSNAVKYNRPGGHVCVALRRDGDRVTIEVSDTGIGIAEEDSDRLFEEFVRIRSEQTRDVRGSGLGLSIVKKLSQLYGGDITMRSCPQLGTTFTVTLTCPGEVQPSEPVGSLTNQLPGPGTPRKGLG
jgi:signal transduction histidine kinase